jgi:large subunit ribosomal protein L4
MGNAKCKKYDLSGSEIQELDFSYGDEPKANTQSIKDYIVALRANARQWSACTKTRSENNHSGAKPHAQKGTGKARQGFLGAPQYRGGGRVHAPRPKFDQHVRINQKERRAAIKALFIDKMRAGAVIVLQEQFDLYFEQPKTKAIASFLDSIGWAGKSVMMLGRPVTTVAEKNFRLSIRNVPRASLIMFENVNGYDILANQKLIVMESVLSDMEASLRR